MQTSRSRAPALALTLALTHLGGCARAEDSFEPAPVVADVVAPAPSAAPTAQHAANPNDQRKIVREGELTLEVDSVDAFRPLLEAELASVGGHMTDASVQHVDGKISGGQFTLRLPQDEIARFTTKCRSWGVVTQEDLRAREITAEYHDESARLTNARKLEQRLLALVDAQANSVKDLLEVERELARVREQIETLEGHIRLYDSQVALATLALRVATRERFVAATPPTFMSQVGSAFTGSTRVLTNMARGGALLCVALVPWLPLGLGMWLLLRLIRRRRTNAA